MSQHGAGPPPCNPIKMLSHPVLSQIDNVVEEIQSGKSLQEATAKQLRLFACVSQTPEGDSVHVTLKMLLLSLTYFPHAPGCSSPTSCHSCEGESWGDRIRVV